MRGLDELRDLRRFLRNECLVGEPRHQPEDQLVEEEHDAVVTEVGLRAG